MITARLNPPRWPNGPQICDEANLPSFASARAAVDAVADFHLLMLSALWECRICGGWHLWTVRATDSSGNAFSGTVDDRGVPVVCARIQKLIERTKKL